VEDLLRSRNLRVTAQRRVVLTLLLEQEGRHWSADTIWEEARAQLPEISRATVYNVLADLVAAGIAEDIPVGDGRLYGLRLTPHHHFVCRSCGRWTDLSPQLLEEAGMAIPLPPRLPGRKVEEVRVILTGLCPACSQAASQAASAPRDPP
jgi:Fe2+ or Zn2+ uptake regulation protein